MLVLKICFLISWASRKTIEFRRKQKTTLHRLMIQQIKGLNGAPRPLSRRFRFHCWHRQEVGRQNTRLILSFKKDHFYDSHCSALQKASQSLVNLILLLTNILGIIRLIDSWVIPAEAFSGTTRTQSKFANVTSSGAILERKLQKERDLWLVIM